ncbi:MAG: AAA family ATPase [Tissierellia bacterium]|nr:AAA family ATPase [Tissierellia bacterium]
MISYLRLKNFMSFKDVVLDLRGSKEIPKQMIAIYGENGSGKTNLIQALEVISRSTMSLTSILEIDNLKKQLERMREEDTRSDAFRLIEFDRVMNNHFSNMRRVFTSYKTKESTGHLLIELGFYLNGKNGYYFLELDERGVVFEELKYVINEKIGSHYRITRKEKVLSPSIFQDDKYVDELYELMEKYWGKHTLLAIIANEFKIKNKEYISNRISSNLLDVLYWIQSMSIYSASDYHSIKRFSTPFPVLFGLKEGSVNDPDDHQLRAFERALRNFFLPLYSDIKNIYYRFEKDADTYRYEIIFTKLVASKLIDLRYGQESTGTQKLLDLFSYLFMSEYGGTVCIDEIDTGIHDLLMVEIIENLSDTLSGQLIMTTHNTALMQHLKKDNIYIINIDVYGNKEIICLSEYDFRTQKNHNIQNMYLRGMYNGVPVVGNLDIQEIVDNAQQELAEYTVDKSI